MTGRLMRTVVTRRMLPSGGDAVNGITHRRKSQRLSLANSLNWRCLFGRDLALLASLADSLR